MQHPVGARFNPDTGRAELESIWTLLGNNTAWAAFPHAVAGAFLTASTFVVGIAGCGWCATCARPDPPLRRSAGVLENDCAWNVPTRRPDGMLVMIIAGIAVIYTVTSRASSCSSNNPEDGVRGVVVPHRNRSGLLDPHRGHPQHCDSVTHVLKVPYVLPWLAEGKISGVTLQGVEDLQAQYEEQFGPGNYRPNLFVTYWSFRAMIGLAAGSAALALAGLWVTRKGRVPDQNWFSGCRSSRSRRRSSRTVRAGSSPRWAVSRGWCTPTRPVST